ncbi:MAG: hypothetical protein HUU21_01525 [Polyangiaceae bacterium]|nr:hypothetical protein [Polyangiaceae bacterium]
MQKNKIWLVAAVALLGLAAWLMSRGDSVASTEDKKPRVEFPRYPKQSEQARNRRRQTLPAPPARDDSDIQPAKRDPMITALPPSKGKSVVVFEASALKETPIAKHWLDCMMSGRQRRGLDRFRDRYGVDLLEDIERLAVSSEEVIIASGDFSGANWEEMDGPPRVYGDKGVLFERGGEGRRREVLGIWNDEMVLMASHAEAIEEAMDRLEDRAPFSEPRLREWDQYGDVYGVLSADDIAKLFPEDQRELADRLRNAVKDVELHVDASEDVAIVADVAGEVESEMEDLAKSLGGALSLARLKAQSDGEDKLAELLDFAKIRPSGGKFSIDLALPLDVLIRQMGPCRKDETEDFDE